MARKQGDVQIAITLTALLLLPSAALAHDPDGWGVASIASLLILIMVCILLIRMGWHLGRKLTNNKSNRFRILISVLLSVLAVTISVISFPLYFWLTYWVYELF